jgi:hypothetical protein
MNWINIKDKKPEENELVIIWETSLYTKRWCEAYLENDCFVVDLERSIYVSIEEVSHWMIPTKPE